MSVQTFSCFEFEFVMLGNFLVRTKQRTIRIKFLLRKVFVSAQNWARNVPRKHKAREEITSPALTASFQSLLIVGLYY